ncbi:MAG: endo-1,4-beta-xylanase [Opitutales bacterium]|nr:endo-1,4-beta-xylanase [Opitutales bacterium]
MAPLCVLFHSVACVAGNAAPQTPDPQWRLSDGTLTSEAPETAFTEDGILSIARSLPALPVFPLPFAVEAGDVVSIEIELEAAEAGEDGDSGQAGLILSVLPLDADRTYNTSADFRQIVLVGTDAERFRFAYVSPRSFEAGESGLLAAMSYFHRPLLVNSLSINNHGPDEDPAALTAGVISYRGHEAEAPWRAEARRRIERHRMADLTVVVTDRVGNPLPEATVAVRQLRHAYPFGTAGVAGRIVDAERVFDPENHPDPEAAREQWFEDNPRYREALLENFNTVVYENDLKWPQWSGAQGAGIRDQHWTVDSLEWLRDHRMYIKGHTLVWGSWRFTPDWLRELEERPEEVQAAVLSHIRDIGGATKDYVRWWDVVNEPMSHRNVIELLGMDQVAEWFKEARAVMPEVRLVINEFDIVGNGGSPRRREGFVEFCKDLIERGAPIDVIGFQGHFWSDRLTAPEDVWAIMDEVHGALNLPLMISEFDMNLPNEALQADYTRDFITAWFAHPATEAFIMWGFWGGAHWMGDSGSMIRRDWTEKPNFAAYRDLVYDEWWTDETLDTDASGKAALRAFHGRHEITVTYGDRRTFLRRIELPPEGGTLHVVVPGDPH